MWEHSKIKLPIITLTVVLTLMVWLWYVNFHMLNLLADTGYIYILGKVTSLLAAAIIASTISLLVFLAKTNPRQLTRVIRFSRARLIDAILLWILIPTALFYYLPIANNNQIRYPTNGITPELILAQFALFAGCYLVSSIIISCIKRRLVRFAVFILVGFSVYLTTLLWLGVQPAF